MTLPPHIVNKARISSGHMVVNSGQNRQIHKEIIVNNGQW